MASAVAPTLTIFTLVFFILNCAADSRETWDAVLAKRVVFAVDTSASMLLDDKNNKVKQAISVWTKYLSPPNISIGVSQLKLNEDLSVRNVAGSSLRAILPEEDFFGSTCLFCGLKEAAKVLEDSSAQDIVVLLMEERAEDVPHDTPEFALQSVQPRFRIFTVALTENADPEIEDLAVATHGASDFIKEPNFARLLLSFDTLPIAKSYSIITTQECEEDGYNCPVEFELDESVSSPHSSLAVFMCPHRNPNSVVKLDYDLLNVNLDEGDHVEPLLPQLDSDTGCWVFQQENPQNGIWQLKVSTVNDSSSVAVVLLHQDYHKLQCFTSISNEDIYLKARVDPPFENLDRLDISAFVQVDDEVTDGISMEVESPGVYSACLKPTGKIGRHPVLCKVKKSGVALLESQAHSFKVDEWPADKIYCAAKAPALPTDQTVQENSTNSAVLVKDTHLWLPETNAEDSAEEKSIVDEVVTLESTEATNLTVLVLNEEPASRTLSPDSAQMIIFVVGGIILAEMVFIFIRCRRKAKNRERRRSLIPYSVESKVSSDLMYHQVSHKDVDQII